MNRIEFITTIAIVLFIVFALGWFSNWMLGRLIRVSEKDVAELDAMGHALHQAEESRDRALQHLQQRETELMNQLTQSDAERSAAMEALRHARLETEELRAHLEQLKSGCQPFPKDTRSEIRRAQSTFDV